MSLLGGRHSIRGMALLLACLAAAITGCEYGDDVGDPTAAPARSARPAPPPPPTADPGLGKNESRNLAVLEVLMGPRPGGTVLDGAGGLGGSGFRKSVRALDKGSYTVTAACIGIPNAVLHISQSNLRGGTTHELALDCGTTATTTLELEDGPVLAQGIRMTPEPGAGSVVGFWIVPAT
ncbi:hypothetical protein [Arthrobacter sp. ISL-69]|uniref:hypothetical protein n=1 Tax=Arthrobacter sp. ISL-69 TaxID=2819113 RepID=UPI001BED003F|nr:hypothetical protein [Arthrobacter sp. ISL-69]